MKKRTERLKERLEKKGFKISYIETNKNGVINKGISISKVDSLIGKIYYLHESDELLGDDEFTEKLIDFYSGTPELNINVDDILFDKEYIKGNLIYGLEREVAEHVLSWNYDDMKGFFKLRVEGIDSRTDATIKIPKNLLSHPDFPCTLEELHEYATENTMEIASFNSMKNLMRKEMENGFVPEEVITEMLDSMPNDIYVATVNSRYGGACVLMVREIMDDICGLFQTDKLLILPSSIHEILITTTDKMSIEDATEMVQTVNKETVEMEDRLSDTAKIYKKGFGIE